VTRLRLVPPTPPTAKQAVIERVKAMPNPRRELQCPRCGSRMHVTVYSGATHDGERIRSGTQLDKLLCAHCYQKGVKQSLAPELKRIE